MSVGSEPSFIDNGPGPAQKRGLDQVPGYVQDRFLSDNFTKEEFFGRWRQTINKPAPTLAKGWTIHDVVAEERFRQRLQEESPSGHRQSLIVNSGAVQAPNGEESQPATGTASNLNAVAEDISIDEDDRITLNAVNIIPEGNSEVESYAFHCSCCRFNEQADSCIPLETIEWSILTPLLLIAALIALRFVISQVPQWTEGLVEGKVFSY